MVLGNYWRIMSDSKLFEEFLEWRNGRIVGGLVGKEKVEYEFAQPSAVAPAVIHSAKFQEWAATAKPNSVYRVLVSPDAQLPYEDKEACNAVEQYVADNRFDEWVDLGDFLDLDFLSRHNKGKARLNAGKMLKEHYAYGREVLDRRLDCLRKNNRRATMTLIEGNHDYRVEALLDEQPEFEGMIEVAEGLGLAERKIQWIRSWRDGTIYKIGKAAFTHGLYTSTYHARKMVENYCCNIFYGHVHDVQQFSKVMHGHDEVVVGQAMGCLCRLDQAYIKQNPKNWQLAFGDFFFRPDGMFTYYIPRIFDGQFTAPSGKTYKGRVR